jgi:hypothetical protein
MSRPFHLAKNHDRYGELSALVLIGQASPAEYRELEAHLASCKACQAEYKDFNEILSNQLPLIDQEHTFTPALQDEGFDIDESQSAEETATQKYAPSFVKERPQSEPKWWHGLQPARISSYALALILVAAIGCLSLRIYRDAKVNQAQSRELERLRNEISAFSHQSQKSPETAPQQSTDLQAPSKQSGKPAALAAAEYAELQGRNRTLNESLKRAGEEIDSLRSELDLSRSKETEVSSRASEAEQSLAQLRTELQAVSQAKAISEEKLRNRETELQSLSQETDSLRDGVERDRRLLAASRDITNLMGARNLRIVDVFDVDPKGRTKKPFGRVFFTEGKSLIFYAFDLGQDRPAVHAASFQAWGAQGSSQPSAKSLGIFYRDDQTANRWVLKFDDPQVLAEIDSVFVTVEPPGGSNKPTGATLLSAYVKANLNHP